MPWTTCTGLALLGEDCKRDGWGRRMGRAIPPPLTPALSARERALLRAKTASQPRMLTIHAERLDARGFSAMGAIADLRRWAHFTEPSRSGVGSVNSWLSPFHGKVPQEGKKPNPEELALVSNVPNGANPLLHPPAAGRRARFALRSR